jgi:hypothetical protein
MILDIRLDTADALTADGGIVTIRPVRPEDRDAVTRLYDEASPESLLLRFFAVPSSASLAAEVDRLCAPEPDSHVAMLAAEADTVIGVTSRGCPDSTGRRAEFAVFVADAHRGRGIDAHSSRKAVRQALDEGGGWQPCKRTVEILDPYGIAVFPASTATSRVAALTTANRLGYPIVLKSADTALVHRTDTGGVRLGLHGPEEVREAFDAVAAAGRPGTGVLVQRQITAPRRAGSRRRARPVVRLGGAARPRRCAHRPDRWPSAAPGADDRPRRRPDVAQPARAPLLTGCRGSAPVDNAAPEDLLLRLGRLAEDLPEVAELDLNPVLAGPDGVVAVDAKLRLAPVGAEPDPMLRVLRPADPSREETPS